MFFKHDVWFVVQDFYVFLLFSTTPALYLPPHLDSHHTSFSSSSRTNQEQVLPCLYHASARHLVKRATRTSFAWELTEKNQKQPRRNLTIEIEDHIICSDNCYRKCLQINPMSENMRKQNVPKSCECGLKKHGIRLCMNLSLPLRRTTPPLWQNPVVRWVRHGDCENLVKRRINQK